MWKKLGLIFKNENSGNPFLVSHASNPQANFLGSDVYRIFYSARDKENKSSISYFDFNLKTKKKITQSKEPVLTYGTKDSFTSHGISIGCSYKVNNRDYFLFMAWQIRGNNHWRGDIGRCEILENELKLTSNKPFIGVDEKVDKTSLSYPWVIFENGLYKMWYGSTLNWTSENGEMIHVINYATSKDGENWQKHGLAIPYEIGIAQAFSRPCVIHYEDGYHMWFSFRSGDGTPYRIGYAKSKDGISWVLALDEVGIDVSETGWDNEMICYPFVFDHEGERYMLYNGNGFGKTGIGLARWEN